MKEIAELLRELPWVTLLTLASGYAGYFLSHVGVRDHHKATDVAFVTLIFGLIAAGIYHIMTGTLEISVAWASITAFLGSTICGAIWNAFGRSLLYKVLRSTGISYNDDTPSAWASMYNARHGGVRELYVLVQDGTWLGCNNLQDFADEPNPGCAFGPDGDILMYVTHRKKPGDKAFEECPSVRDEWGTEITYIPKSQIARVDIRRLK